MRRRRPRRPRRRRVRHALLIQACLHKCTIIRENATAFRVCTLEGIKYQVRVVTAYILGSIGKNIPYHGAHVALKADDSDDRDGKVGGHANQWGR